MINKWATSYEVEEFKGLNSILKYQSLEYFELNKSKQFLISTIYPLIKVASLELYKGTYWFNYSKIQIKATTTPSIALDDLEGTKIKLNNIVGEIRGLNWGLNNTPYIGIKWGRISTKVPHPYFWNDINNLNLAL